MPMVWNDDNRRDDSWKDSYDAWKLASPDDEYQDECEHLEFEIDLEGRAHCDVCDGCWWASAEEIASQRQRQREFDAWCRREEWRERWRRLTRLFRWPAYRLLERLWPRKACSVLYDDEIPF